MPLIFRHDDFYGRLQLRRTLPGFTLAHRIAEGPADSVETHTHVEAHFVLVTSGEYVSSARGTPRGLRPLVYNPPGTTHRDHFRNGVGSFFTVSMSADCFVDGSREIDTPAFIVGGVRSYGLASALLWNSAQVNHCCDVDLEILLQELLASLGEREPIPGRAEERHRSRPPWLRRAYEKLGDCYRENLTVRELASAVGIHPIHLARSFRIFYGCTPGQLIQLRRVEKVADLLLFSSLPLAEVALVSGFTDQSHMTTSFRRLYGLTPARFRRTRSSNRLWPRSNVSFLQDSRTQNAARIVP